MTEEVTLYESSPPAFALSRPPEEILADAERAAQALTKMVRTHQLSKRFGDREHLLIAGWQILGQFYGFMAECPEGSTRYVEYGDARGFEATAVLRHPASGSKISEATSMCLSDEEHWRVRTKYEWRQGKRVPVGTEAVPLFQLRSMAQTRAMSRVHANVLRWVAESGGYSGTPAEEVDTGRAASSEASPEMPARRSGKNQERITEAQVGRLEAKAKAARLTDEGLTAWLQENGFSRPEEVTRGRYAALCTALDQAAERHRRDTNPTEGDH